MYNIIQSAEPKTEGGIPAAAPSGRAPTVERAAVIVAQ